MPLPAVQAPSSLQMLGEVTRAPSRPTGSALAAKGFRPFFLLGAGFAVAILPLWLLALLGVIPAGSYFDPLAWHAHEMVLGFATAIIAGFLLTAVGNWTGRETLVGPPLLALAALWLFGRVAVTGPSLLAPPLIAAVDLAFVPVLGIVLARPLILSRHRHDLVMLGALSALFVANVAMHLDALGVTHGSMRQARFAAVDVVVLVILILSGRVFPMFTRNATGVQSIRSVPALDALAIGSMAVLTVLDAAAAPIAVSATVAGVTGALAAARTVRWGARHSLGLPLVWVLHLGYAWIPLGLVLRASSAWLAWVPPSLATHALTVGGIGTLTLGMMSRVTLGHTGRALDAPRPLVVAFVVSTASAIVRVLGPLASPSFYCASLVAAGILWSAAFALYLVVLAPALVSPRPDGKPG